ncbi:peptidase A24A prepilin type IV [Desulfovibrio sp. X2]|uniref:A24 family peptidase n=1 Tax=Desulfovibrio sp. X2 TaxID=941449 RepID=UPI000358890F|nr:A24 family peptidase [Desulfovibrio sp. X2]EPR44150.1 peptidase A24A prepilin type IV [Desulfovibrio sp. X2]
MDIALNGFLSIVLAIACVTDVREQRIPNWLTYPAMVVALAAHGILGGSGGFLFSLSGLGVGFGLMLLPFLMGVMGAGDVKLLAAAGAVMGTWWIVEAFILTSLFGGVYALAVICCRRTAFRARLLALKDSLLLTAATGSLTWTAPTDDTRLPRLCYGLAIAAGCWARMAMAVWTPDLLHLG